jgi:hypothetical protein
VELMTVSAGSVAGARISGVDPQTEAIRHSGFVRVTLWGILFAQHRHLYAQTKLVPGQPHIAELAVAIELSMIEEGGLLGKIEYVVIVRG